MEKFILIRWPESQQIMEESWFEEEAVLDVDELYGSSAYLIPEERYKEFINSHDETKTN